MLAWLIASAMFRAYTNKQLGKNGKSDLPVFFIKKGMLITSNYPYSRFPLQAAESAVFQNKFISQRQVSPVKA